MAFEDLEAELGILLGRLTNAPRDRGEIHERLREMINEMRAMGMPIPEDLARLEHDLHDDLFGESQVLRVYSCAFSCSNYEILPDRGRKPSPG